MNRLSVISIVFFALIVLGACIAGCSDSSSGEPATVQQPVATTPSGPLYSAGDIVKNPKSSSGTALLIIAYNAAGDTYERAYIYPNPDGSWGYRLDAKTDSIDRAVIERVYTEKAGSVTISSVRIQSAPTVTISSGVTGTTTATATATVTATATKAPAPKVKMVDPDKGKTGTTVSITDITGDNFQSGANVSLKMKGENPIHATDVVVATNLISCKVAIPPDATLGYWNLVVTNPDKQSDEYLNAFLVQQGTATATTTSTSSSTTTNTLVVIQQVQTPLIVTGGAEDTKSVEILGTNLSAGNNMKLTKGSTTLTGIGYHMKTTSIAEARFEFPAGSTGTYSISIIDKNGNVLATKADSLNVQ